MTNIDTQETDYSVYPLVSSKYQCPLLDFIFAPQVRYTKVHENGSHHNCMYCST